MDWLNWDFLMIRYNLANVSALLLIAIASSVMLGWIFHEPILVQFKSGMVGMVMNTAVNFFIIGVAILLFDKVNKFTNLTRTVCLLVVLIFACLSFSQDIFHYSLGLDNLFIHSWLVDPNPTPGRMAPNTSVGFILASLTGLLIPYGRKKIVADLVHIFTFAIFLMAIAGVLVYALKLELILKWYNYTRMAIPTAICFCIASLSWWGVWSQAEWQQHFYTGKEDKKIVFITAIILITLIVVAGFSSLAGLAYLTVTEVNQSLLKNLDAKNSYFTQKITDAEKNVLAITTNTALWKNINEPNNNINQLYNKGLFKQDFNAVEVKNNQGSVIFTAGELIQPLHFSVPLKTTRGQGYLFWNQGFWLKLTMPIMLGDSQTTVGQFTAEMPLPAADKVLRDFNGLGETGEITICYLTNESEGACFPNRQKLMPFTTPLSINGQSIPMSYALSGKIGSITSFDYSGKTVIAAYSPIDDLGLGMVIKIQTSEIYAPLHNEVILIFLIAFTLGVFSLFIVRWQLTPLVRKVIDSEKKANIANKKLEITIEELHQRNQEISLLRDLSEALQSCLSMKEAYPIIKRLGEKILPDTSAILFLIPLSHGNFEAKLSWGQPHSLGDTLKADDCWALRKHTLYRVKNATDDVVCSHAHVTTDKEFSYLCIPLLSQNTAVGLLYIETDPTHPIQEKEFLATALSEQVTLGLNNIHLRETLKVQSISDPLSGLYNRRYLKEAFDHEMVIAAHDHSSISILMIDIDHFKKFNDTFGHDAGDLVLQAIGETLRDIAPENNIACRYGGEEFILVMPHTDESIALYQAENLHKKVARISLHHLDNLLGSLTISIGIASYPRHGKTMQAVITAADAALYQAKNTGRNKTIINDSLLN
jgi:diguanylate cyclase (GGDEF)-like protein